MYKKEMTRTGFEPMLPPWKGGVLTTWPTGHIGLRRRGDSNPRAVLPTYALSKGASSATWVLLQMYLNGLEPSTSRLSGVRSKPAELQIHSI